DRRRQTSSPSRGLTSARYRLPNPSGRRSTVNREGKAALCTMLFRVEARPGKRQELRQFLEGDRNEALQHERGTHRFDIFQDPDAESAFIVYEAYEDASAFAEHKEREPYQRWKSQEFQEDVVLRWAPFQPV